MKAAILAGGLGTRLSEGSKLRESLARDGELIAFRHTGFWQPMDTLRDKNALETMWASGEAPWKLWA